MILDEGFSPRYFETRMVYQCPNGGAKTIDSDICMEIGIFRLTLFDSSSVSCFFMLSLKLDFFFLHVFLIGCVCFVLEISQRRRSFRHQSLTIAKWLKVLDFFLLHQT